MEEKTRHLQRRQTPSAQLRRSKTCPRRRPTPLPKEIRRSQPLQRLPLRPPHPHQSQLHLFLVPRAPLLEIRSKLRPLPLIKIKILHEHHTICRLAPQALYLRAFPKAAATVAISEMSGTAVALEREIRETRARREIPGTLGSTRRVQTEAVNYRLPNSVVRHAM